MISRIALIAGLALAVPTAVHAQAATSTATTAADAPDGKAGDIVVVGRFLSTGAQSATKADVSVLDTPFSVAAYSDSFVKSIESTNVADLYNYMTGVKKSGNTGYDVTLRGFKSSGDDRNAIMVDGLPGLTGRYGSPPTVNVDHVELVKGPMSVLYGQIQPGGFINIISKKPQAKSETSVSLRGNTFVSKYRKGFEHNGLTGDLDTTGALNESGSLMYRFVGEIADNEGFRDYARTQQQFFSPSLTLDLGTTKVTASFEYRHVKEHFDVGLAAPPNTKDATATIYDIDQMAPITTTYQQPGDYRKETGKAAELFVTQDLGSSWKFRGGYPRDSNHSVFTVASFAAADSQAAAGALKPLLDKQRGAKTVMRYTLYRDKEASGRSWLLTEYRDPTAFARGSDAGKEAAVKLGGAVTKARYLELPAPQLSGLAAYKPQAKLTGTLRIYGSELKNSVEYLARGFQEFHPDLRITWSNATSSEGALAGLYTGIADVAPMGDDAKLTDQMPFFNATGYLPTEVSVSTGGYERRGSLWAWAIVVNKDNPLKSISIDELQNVFGAERTGGWKILPDNILFTAEYAKDKSTDIRTWDKLGLSGPFRGKEIMTYGYSAPGFQQAIERHWFHWSHKWNPNFKEYVEAKMAVDGPDGEAVKSERPLEILSKDKFGIGIAGMMHVKDYPNLKVLPLSWHKGGEAIAFTPENVANRKYPMIRDGYFYVNKAPGQPLDPKVREFMRFVLSREGQEIIAKVGYYYPLDRATAEAQMKKLD